MAGRGGKISKILWTGNLKQMLVIRKNYNDLNGREATDKDPV